MNLSYFMSVLELYLNKEKEYKTNLSISKYPNSRVMVNFTMNHDLNETTSFYLEYDSFMEKDNLCLVLDKYKANLIIIDEKYEYDKLHETCYYCIMLSNSRILSFKNFSLEEVNYIRNLVYDIKYNPNEIKIILDEEQKNGYYQPRKLLGETGFVNYLTMFTIVIWLLNVLIISLWVFKNFI